MQSIEKYGIMMYPKAFFILCTTVWYPVTPSLCCVEGDVKLSPSEENAVRLFKGS
jgi:hypothetical protein